MTARLRLVALVAAGLVACHQAGDRLGRAAAVLVDDAGDTLRIARPARRIVSLNPTTTELLFALGAGDRLVGRTDACDYPAAAAGVPSVGAWLPPNVEAVAARSPDLVLLYGSRTNAAAASRLRSLGIAVLALRTDHLADVPRAARLLGRVVDAVPAADSLARSFVAALDPLAIVTVGAMTAGFTARPEWQAVRAVRRHRLLTLSESAFNRPSPRAPAAIAVLRHRLDPVLH